MLSGLTQGAKINYMGIFYITNKNGKNNKVETL